MGIKKAVSEKTEKILLDVLAYLEEEKARLDMGGWGRSHNIKDDEICSYLGHPITTESKEIYKKQPRPRCGTTACIGGTVLLVTEEGRKFLKFTEVDGQTFVIFPPNTSDIARKLLDISCDQADSLFLLPGWSSRPDGGWSVEQAKKYVNARTPEGRFNATKERVLHFIQTGK